MYTKTFKCEDGIYLGYKLLAKSIVLSAIGQIMAIQRQLYISLLSN